ncbi:MAG: hypothetical protein ACREAQ_07280 [Nitrososphaera sp.]
MLHPAPIVRLSDFIVIATLGGSKRHVIAAIFGTRVDVEPACTTVANSRRHGIPGFRAVSVEHRQTIRLSQAACLIVKIF